MYINLSKSHIILHVVYVTHFTIRKSKHSKGIFCHVYKCIIKAVNTG